MKTKRYNLVAFFLMAQLLMSCNPLGNSNSVSGDLCIPTTTNTDCSGNQGNGGGGGNTTPTNASVTINKTSSQDELTNQPMIEFTAVFSEEIDPATFEVSDISQLGTSTVTWSIDDEGDSTTFTLTATATTDGTVIPFVGGNTVSTATGGFNTASTGTEGVVTYDTFINPPSNIVHGATLLSTPDSANTTWTISPDVDLVQYQLAVGTTGVGAGQNNLVDWTNVGNVSVHPGFLSIIGIADCTDYFTSVRAIDQAGNISIASTTPVAFQVDTTAPTAPSMLAISNTFAKTDRTNTVSWTASTDNCVFDQYEYAVGTTGSGAGQNDVIDWLEIGNVTSFTALHPTDATFALAHGTDYYTSIRAKDDVGNISTVQTTSAWQLNYNYAKLTSTSTTGGANLNQASLTTLSWVVDVMDTAVFDYDGGTPSEIEFLLAGDYLAELILPMDSTVQRSNIRVQMYLDGTLVQGSRAESGYIRNGSAHSESSNHIHFLIPSVVANQVLDVRVQQIAASGTVNITDQVSLVLRKVDSSEKVINARATTANAGTNFNQATATALLWTRNGSDRYDASVFAHTSGDDEITVLETGDYLVYYNVPLNDPNGNQGNRTAIVGEVKHNGTTIGYARQGYMRRASGHNEASIHFAGIVRNVSASDILTFTVARDTSVTQTVNIGTGQAASVYIQKIENTEYIDLSGTTLNNGASGQTNWNQAGEVEWTTQNSNDATVFTHNTGVDPQDITILQDGDYYVVFNDHLTSAVQRANVTIQLQVNGVNVTGAICKSQYIRNADSHTRASCSFATLLDDLSSGDIVTITTTQEGESGTVTASSSANLLMWKRP